MGKTRGRTPDPNPTPDMLRQREQYRLRSERLKAIRKAIRKARGIELVPTNQYTTDVLDRMELIDVPIKPTSIGWEHISSGRSNS